ncbi:competence type IV pilus minor pilin ComGF [Virgibacillus sp. DJP39]|uniref:competence type IV pilus minor pilin ComGF n=1 Tax=Virgibacillus sp. DJP39 TaxID=3409790 RepID=UPI003BB58B2D
MKKKSRAYMGMLVNQKGFTLLSMLLTVAMLFITIPFLEYMTKSLSYTNNYTDLSYYQFFHFFRDDLIRSTNYTTYDQGIALSAVDGTIVTYEKYENVIRRQVNGTGHEVVIRGINSLNFESITYGIKTVISTTDGAVYEKKFTVYK